MTKILTKNQKRIVLAVFLMMYQLTVHAATINFDAVYGNSGNIAQKISTAINNADAGDIIRFNSTFYNFGNRGVTVNKAITFQGLDPSNNNSNNRGAYGLRTTFGGVTRFTIRSNNITFRNLSLMSNDINGILIDARHPNFINSTGDLSQIYRGIIFRNVVLSGSAYPFHGGNGIAGSFVNVNFVNYRDIGCWIDRKGRVNNIPRIVWRRCLFRPLNNNVSDVGFNDRAISIDAGNDEYPVVWNAQNSLIEFCRFEHTGLAFSKVANIVVRDNIFNDNVGRVQMIHIEEFSRNYLVQRNTFNCLNPNVLSEVIGLDREIQSVDNIRVLNNTITGRYHLFMSGYANTNITVTGNNFTNANTVGSSMLMDFYANATTIPLPQPIPSDGVIVRNNPGLQLAANGNISIIVRQNNANNDLSNYPVARRRIERVNPPNALLTNGRYRIASIANGRRLVSAGNGTVLSSSTPSPNTDLWDIRWIPPFRYSIQNVATGRFLEVNIGYTEANILRNDPQNRRPFQSFFTNPRPYWSVLPGNNGFFRFYTGGNEFQSAMIMPADNTPRLAFGRRFENNRRVLNDLGVRGQWNFNRVGNLPIAQPNIESNLIYNTKTSFDVNPNPAISNVVITLDDSKEIQKKINIFSMQGALVKSINTEHNKFVYSVNISDFQKGIYIIQSGNNQKKLMIE